MGGGGGESESARIHNEELAKIVPIRHNRTTSSGKFVIPIEHIAICLCGS